MWSTRWQCRSQCRRAPESTLGTVREPVGVVLEGQWLDAAEVALPRRLTCSEASPASDGR
jgi:hypothetical protein